MIKRLIFILLIIFLLPFYGYSQDTDYGFGYRTGMLINPALSGAAGDGQLKLLYYNFYPGNGYDLNSFFMSYDTYVPVLHGGTGFYVSNDVLGGIINDFRSGFGYAYHLKVGKNLFFNAGLTASILSRGLNRGRIILPDQIDPLGGNILPSAESVSDINHTVIDIGAGFLLTYKNISAGISLNHFAEPDLSGTKIDEFRLKRKYTFQLSGRFNEGTNKLSVTPIASFESQGDHFSAAVGSAVGYNVLSFNSIIIADKEKDIDLQTGFSVLTGKAVIFYTYKFNITTKGSQSPFSLLHEAGVTLRLNIVDKRKLIKTINFPEL